MCEVSGSTPWAEPWSTVTSFGFVAVGFALLVALARREDRGPPAGTRVAYALLTIAVGLGSAVQHGLAPAWNPVVHDPPLFGVLALVAADGVADLTGRRLGAWWWAAPTIGCAALAALAPGASAVVQGLAAAVAIGVSLLRAARRPPLRRRLRIALTLLAVGASLGTLGRPGWPLCDPDSWLQTHAVWHLLAAAALWVLAPVVGTRRGGQPAQA